MKQTKSKYYGETSKVKTTKPPWIRDFTVFRSNKIPDAKQIKQHLFIWNTQLLSFASPSFSRTLVTRRSWTAAQED